MSHIDSPDIEIIIVQEIGRIQLHPHGTQNPVAEAFQLAGEYISEADSDVSVRLTFEFAGRTFVAIGEAS